MTSLTNMPTPRQCKGLFPYCLFHLLVGAFANLQISVCFLTSSVRKSPGNLRTYLHQIKNHVALKEKSKLWRKIIIPRTLLLPPNRLRPSFFAIFFILLDENPRNFRSEHFRTSPNFHYSDILLSHTYFRHFPLTRNVNFHAAYTIGE